MVNVALRRLCNDKKNYIKAVSHEHKQKRQQNNSYLKYPNFVYFLT